MTLSNKMTSRVDDVSHDVKQKKKKQFDDMSFLFDLLSLLFFRFELTSAVKQFDGPSDQTIDGQFTSRTHV